MCPCEGQRDSLNRAFSGRRVAPRAKEGDKVAQGLATRDGRMTRGQEWGVVREALPDLSVKTALLQDIADGFGFFYNLLLNNTSFLVC